MVDLVRKQSQIKSLQGNYCICETRTQSSFLEYYFGFHHDHLPITTVVLIISPPVLAFHFAYCIGKLNFLRR